MYICVFIYIIAKITNTLMCFLGGELCFQATGTIDGKFDCGYLVSIKLGSETLSGVLYHPDNSGYYRDNVKGSCTDIVPFTGHNHNHNHHHHHHQNQQQFLHSQPQPQPHQYSSGQRKRRRRRGGDPNRPKPNRSGYNFFFAEKHSLLKTLYPNREREFTKMIGESWNNLSPEERTVSVHFNPSKQVFLQISSCI